MAPQILLSVACCCRGLSLRPAVGFEIQIASGEPFHDRGHFARRGLAQPKERLIGGHGTGRRHVDFLVEHRLFEPGGAQRGVDVVEAKAVDRQVGRGVVAENDHQRKSVPQGERERRIKLAKYARPSHLIGLHEDQLFVQRGLAVADLLRGVEQNAHLDDGGGLDWHIGSQRSGCTACAGSGRRDLPCRDGLRRWSGVAGPGLVFPRRRGFGESGCGGEEGDEQGEFQATSARTSCVQSSGSWSG